MTRKYLICRQQKKNCPFRTLNISLDIFICDFYKEYWRIFDNSNSLGVKSLLNRACEWIQDEEKRLNFICQIAQKTTREFFENVQVSDTVFCRIAPYHEVKLLEMPLDNSEFVSCEAPNGKVIRVQAHHLRRISKGNYSGDYFIEGAENEKKAKEFEYKAKYYGFRTEIERTDNGYFLKIYGDSQQEVDDFITLSLEQDFDISPYI